MNVISLAVVKPLIAMNVAEFEPAPEVTNPFSQSAELVAHVINGMEAILLYRDEHRSEKDIYGLGVLGALPVRCAEVFRGDEHEFMQAFKDPRTFDNTLGLLSKDKGKLAVSIERLYGLSIEYLGVDADYDKSLWHLEQSGSFFSLQDTDKEKLIRNPDKGNCPYRKHMHETTITFAERMVELGIIGQLLGNRL